MASVRSGLDGGLLATIGMTEFMLALGDDSSPPTAPSWADSVASVGLPFEGGEFVGWTPDDEPVAALFA